MLLICGHGKNLYKWHVLEKKPPMFSRVYYMLGGTATYTDSIYKKDLEKGKLYIFPTFAPYEITTDHRNPIECFYMHLDIQTAGFFHMIELDLKKDSELTLITELVNRAIENSYPMDYMESLACCFEKLCRLKNIFRTVSGETEKLIKAVRQTYRSDVSVDKIASSMGYSTEYFIRIFKKKVGVSPHQYAISLRMSEAVRMLAGPASMDEIAAAVGYTDGHSFSNAFRRYYGISPKVYREKYAGNI